MTNSSDGGKGDPPYPSNTNINTDALSISSPAAHRAKNALILTGIDPDIKFFVHIDDDDNEDEDALNSPTLTTMNPPKTPDNASAHNGSTTVDEWNAKSWNKVLARYHRCQDPS